MKHLGKKKRYSNELLSARSKKYYIKQYSWRCWKRCHYILWYLACFLSHISKLPTPSPFFVFVICVLLNVKTKESQTCFESIIQICFFVTYLTRYIFLHNGWVVTGSGVTGCINKLAGAIERWPNYNHAKTVVFISKFEHNSNILIWKEKGYSYLISTICFFFFFTFI